MHAVQVGLLNQADLDLEGGNERDQHRGRHQVGDLQGQAGGVAAGQVTDLLGAFFGARDQSA